MNARKSFEYWKIFAQHVETEGMRAFVTMKNVGSFDEFMRCVQIQAACRKLCEALASDEYNGPVSDTLITEYEKATGNKHK